MLSSKTKVWPVVGGVCQGWDEGYLENKKLLSLTTWSAYLQCRYSDLVELWSSGAFEEEDRYKYMIVYDAFGKSYDNLKGKTQSYMSSHRKLLAEFMQNRDPKNPWSQQCPVRQWAAWLSTGSNAPQVMQDYRLERQADRSLNAIYRPRTWLGPEEMRNNDDTCPHSMFQLDESVQKWGDLHITNGNTMGKRQAPDSSTTLVSNPVYANTRQATPVGSSGTPWISTQNVNAPVYSSRGPPPTPAPVPPPIPQPMPFYPHLQTVLRPETLENRTQLQHFPHQQAQMSVPDVIHYANAQPAAPKPEVNCEQKKRQKTVQTVTWQRLTFDNTVPTKRQRC